MDIIPITGLTRVSTTLRGPTTVLAIGSLPTIELNAGPDTLTLIG